MLIKKNNKAKISGKVARSTTENNKIGSKTLSSCRVRYFHNNFSATRIKKYGYFLLPACEMTNKLFAQENPQ